MQTPISRIWSLYLSRPPVIKLTDISIQRPERNTLSWDMNMFAAWVALLEISGHISEKLFVHDYIRFQNGY